MTGKTYSYYHPIALLHGSKLYINGGNFYYSRQVRMNMYMLYIALSIQIFTYLFNIIFNSAY